MPKSAVKAGGRRIGNPKKKPTKAITAGIVLLDSSPYLLTLPFTQEQAATAALAVQGAATGGERPQIIATDRAVTEMDIAVRRSPRLSAQPYYEPKQNRSNSHTSGGSGYSKNFGRVQQPASRQGGGQREGRKSKK
jgi:hypothetical protein